MKNNDDSIWKYATVTGLDLRMHLSFSDGTLNQEWKERLDFDSLDYTVYNVLLCAKLVRVPGGSLSAEKLCTTLLPEEPRLDSYATSHPHHCETDSSVYEFNLLVTKTADGGCSAFLFEAVGQEFSFGISTSSKFHTPRDTTTPIVVIAAGSGLGTFLPLLFNDNIPHPKYAFLAFRAENTVPFLDTHFKNAVSYGKLNLFIEFSREETTIMTVDRKLVRKKTQKCYIDRLLHQEAALLLELARPVKDGGRGAYVYVCGNNEFFQTVRKGMTQVKNHGLSFELLIGESRLHLEVQARGPRGRGAEEQVKRRVVTLGEMCFHNKLNDFWVAIHGIVYDLTPYLSWHPGGRKILNYVAGTDCSKYWDLVSHSRDRMVYSQLSAYEVGVYCDENNASTDDDTSSGLSGYLESVTHCHNAVNLYMDKETAFETFCDSYTRIQGIVEGVFGQEFVEHVMSLVPDRKQFGSVLARIWMVKHGGERLISNKMFKIVPSSGKTNNETASTVSSAGLGFFDLELRNVSQEERVQLGRRLTRACTTFFTRCKEALAEEMARKDAATTAAYTRMFFRLGSSLEQFYNSLATPLPLKEIRGWNIIKEEMYQRKTFLMRFKTLGNAVSAEFETLTCSISPISKGTERESFIDKVLDRLEVDKTPTYRVESKVSGEVIDKWYASEKLRAVFKQLDVDADGLISKEDLQAFLSQDENDRKILEGLEGLMVKDQQKSTYSFEEVLSVSTVIA
jgi:ferredoxin-NADP reductase/predicted heme/steroid binding protein/Ca2+-binding EF-hand superfamily protein